MGRVNQQKAGSGRMFGLGNNLTIIDSTCGTDTTPAAAAGGACEPREAMPFDEWASVQRRRAALDGAWKLPPQAELRPPSPPSLLMDSVPGPLRKDDQAIRDA